MFEMEYNRKTVRWPRYTRNPSNFQKPVLPRQGLLSATAPLPQEGGKYICQSSECTQYEKDLPTMFSSVDEHMTIQNKVPDLVNCGLQVAG
jgi:hypothetical protein